MLLCDVTIVAVFNQKLAGNRNSVQVTRDLTLEKVELITEQPSL